MVSSEKQEHIKLRTECGGKLEPAVDLWNLYGRALHLLLAFVPVLCSLLVYILGYTFYYNNSTMPIEARSSFLCAPNMRERFPVLSNLIEASPSGSIFYRFTFLLVTPGFWFVFLLHTAYLWRCFTTRCPAVIRCFVLVLFAFTCCCTMLACNLFAHTPVFQFPILYSLYHVLHGKMAELTVGLGLVACGLCLIVTALALKRDTFSHKVCLVVLRTVIFFTWICTVQLARWALSASDGSEKSCQFAGVHLLAISEYMVHILVYTSAMLNCMNCMPQLVIRIRHSRLKMETLK